MNWLLFYLLALLHPVVFLLIGFKSSTWKQRFLLWTLLPIPATVYCWDYFAISREHERMCAAEGGLKIMVQPERADRVRLAATVDDYSGRSILEYYYPRLHTAESLTEERHPTTQKRLEVYEISVASANPKVGQPMEKFPWKEPAYQITTSRLDSMDPNVYEIAEHHQPLPHGGKTETTLSKSGRVYAKYTTLIHSWGGIHYPDAIPTWRCPEMVKSPPPGKPDAPLQQWSYPQSPAKSLINLLTR